MKTMLLALAVLAGGGYYLVNQPNLTNPLLQPGHHQAPEGRYYLLAAYPVDHTPHGAQWSPGQEVRAVGSQNPSDGTLTLTDGVSTVAVPHSMLTQDMEEAATLRESETVRQSTVNAAAAQLEIERTRLASATRIQAEQDRQHEATRLGNGTFHATALDEPARFHGYSSSVYYGDAPVVYYQSGTRVYSNGSTGGYNAARQTARVQPQARATLPVTGGTRTSH